MVVEFYRNRKKSINLLLILSGILVVLLLILLYSSGLISDIIIAKGVAFSSIGSLILAIIIIKTLISLKDKSPLIVLSPEGITAKVTAVSKAAGLIFWKDIADIQLHKVGGDTLVTLLINNPEPYAANIRKKLSAMALDKDQDLQIYMTASVLDINAGELFDQVIAYRAQLNPGAASL
ncbi:STM3941 family protein [Pedobacter sp. UYP1]|uniref:STM3941 family protein n=1 Tax=Pedobacter sp. UYP1 TaxID=1756396 RepID=UPI003393EB5E